MSKQIKQSFDEITIKLEPEQRFFYQRESDGALILVDTIDIFAYAKQMNLYGTHFEVDYENKTIEKADDRSFMNFETNLLGEYSEGED